MRLCTLYVYNGPTWVLPTHMAELHMGFYEHIVIYLRHYVANERRMTMAVC